MSDNDLIRRGDVLDEINLYRSDWDYAREAIAALPAVTVGVVCTWPSCGHTARGQCLPTTRLAALEPMPAIDPAVLALVDAAEPLAAMAGRYDPEDGDGDMECWSGLAVPKIKHIRALRASLAAFYKT